MRIIIASPSIGMILWVCCIGCRAQVEVTQQAGQSRLATLAAVYGKYQVAHRGQLPPDEKALRDFLTGHENLASWLKTAGIAHADELFISERDQQPYVLLFGKDALKYVGGVMGYEQRGVAGQRIVGYRAGFVDVLDDAEFDQLIGQR